MFHLKYAPDSQTFASGSEDGMVRIWPTTSIIRKAKEDDVASPPAVSPKTDA